MNEKGNKKGNIQYNLPELNVRVSKLKDSLTTQNRVKKTMLRQVMIKF